MLKYLKALLVLIFIARAVQSQNLNTQGGYYFLPIGDFKVIALSDGTVPVEVTKLLQAPEPGRVEHLLKEAFLEDPTETSINTYLILTGSKRILVDAGAGGLFGPQAGGKLVSSLKNAGYTPAQITDVLLTHVHVDHSGGLAVQGRSVFPNAIIHVNKKELDFWQKHEKPTQAEARGISANRPAYQALKPFLIANKVKVFEGNAQLFPGLRAWEYTGHTAGHSLFVLESKSDKLVFWGDLVHVAAVQLHGPEIPNEYDFDKPKAAQQRQKAYEEAAKQGYLIAADHISFPGIGRIKGSKNGYEWVPVPYSLLGRSR